MPDFAPNLHYAGNNLANFRFWCQKTLPAVYDDSLSYYELLCKVTKFVVDAVDDISELGSAYVQLQDFVNHYFDNLDVQNQINQKLDEMASDGTLGELISNYYEPQNDVIIVTASFGRTNPTGDPSVTITPFTVQCKARIETYSGRKCYWNAKGGVGFRADGFLDVLDDLEGTVVEPNKVGLIMVCGGGNDARPTIDDTEIGLGMQHFMEYVKIHYPNAIVRFAWLSWRATYYANLPQRWFNDCIERYKYLCPRYGIGYCANSEYIFHTYYPSWYLSDNYHPSTVGSTHIADGIMDCINTGSTSVNRREQVTGFLTTLPVLENPVREQADFIINQVDGATTLTPMNVPDAPTFKLNFTDRFIPFAVADAPSSFTFSSNLFMAFIPKEEAVVFPVKIVAVKSGGLRDTYEGLGKLFAGYCYISALRPSTYIAGAYDELWFYFPQITVPTKLA